MQQLALDFDAEPARELLPEPDDALPTPLVMVQIVPFATWHDSRRARRDRRLWLTITEPLHFDPLLLAMGPNLWHEPQYCSGTSRPVVSRETDTSRQSGPERPSAVVPRGARRSYAAEPCAKNRLLRAPFD